MEQSSYSEANGSLVIQDITRTIWNPEVHYRIYERPPHIFILSQIKPVYASPTPLLQDPFYYYAPIST
jgi:hypothetical protein